VFFNIIKLLPKAEVNIRERLNIEVNIAQVKVNIEGAVPYFEEVGSLLLERTETIECHYKN